jgi:hypothetical protein
MRRLALSLLLAAGCSSNKTPPSPAVSASAEPPPTTTTTTASAPPTAPPAQGVDTKPASDCDFRWGYHGNVAGQEAYLRLQRTGEALAGRYFYAKVGVDLPLSGTIDASGGVQLIEGDPKKPSGRFKGTCSSRGEVLDGAWSNEKGDSPFRFERVGPRPVPLTPTKHFKVSRRVPRAKGMPPAECKFEQSVVEIFGAGTPEAERLLNQQDATALKPAIRVKEVHDDAVRCEEGLTADYTVRVAQTFAGLVTIASGGSASSENAAHPANFLGWSRTTYDLSTGKPITERELYAHFPKGLVERCLEAYEKMPNGYSNLEVDGHLFALTPKGVHIFGSGYGHALGVLTGRGPILTWAALLREGALRADSPARRAWAGVAPAKAGDVECLPDD